MSRVPLRRVADVRSSSVDKKTYAGDVPVRLCNYVDVYRNDRVGPYMQLMRATATQDEVDRFRLRVGDSIITKDSEDPLDIGVSAFVEESAKDFVCGYHLAILRPRHEVVPRYLNWAIRSREVRSHWSNQASGMTRYGLGLDGIRSAPIAMVNITEQSRVAQFLDDQVERIDRIIKARRNQTALLRVHYEAELANATARLVNKGRLKDLLSTGPCYGVLKPDYVDQGVPLVRITDLPVTGSVTASELRQIPHEQSVEYERTIVHRGDVLVGVVGTIGRATVVDDHLEGANLSRAVARLQLKPGVPPTYVRGVLRSPAFRRFVDEVTQGSAQPVLNMGDLKNMPVAVPSPFEAFEVAREMEAVEHDFASHTQQSDRSAALLSEFKVALISAALNGELDVTTAGSGIPA